MKYLPVILALLAVSGCAEHHDLTQCKGPYLALAAPEPVTAERTAAAKPPPTQGKPAQQTTVTK